MGDGRQPRTPGVPLEPSPHCVALRNTMAACRGATAMVDMETLMRRQWLRRGARLTRELFRPLEASSMLALKHHAVVINLGRLRQAAAAIVLREGELFVRNMCYHGAGRCSVTIARDDDPVWTWSDTLDAEVRPQVPLGLRLLASTGPSKFTVDVVGDRGEVHILCEYVGELQG